MFAALPSLLVVVALAEGYVHALGEADSSSQKEPIAAAVTTHDAWPTLYASEIDHLVKQAEDYLARVCASYENTEYKVDCKLVHGPVVDAIIKVAEEIDADLIAMASHGRSGLGSVFYGSVAAGVLQRVERPLLLVRSR